jgi:hypothetical protein
MMTAAEGKKQAKALERERAKHLKLQDRAKVRALRESVKRAREAKARRVREAREQCRAHRRAILKRAKARHRRLLEELRETTRLEKLAAKDRCAIGKRTVRESALSDLEKASHALHHERAYQRDLKRIEANNRASHCMIVRASRAERAQESAGEVEGNIPPEYVPLWKRVQGKIKGSSRRSRTEAFLAYAEQHPHEIVEAQEGGVEATIRELERKMAHHAKRARVGRPKYTPAELAAVPF